ncbi:chromatin remodelling complex Rsc7/Swp82 subunit domain-containing protein [Trichoderma barbatum]
MPLPPPVSAAARQTIRTAFDDLDRTITPADSRDFRVSTLQQVRDAALEIERQLAARGSLRNMRRLMPLFKGMEHYSKVMDVLCNGTPYLSWIWAPVALILRIASEYVDAFEQIIKGYSQLASSLGRFEILGNTFAGDPDFQQTLAVFYADILQFHKHAYKFVRRSGWKLLFLTSWGRFQRRFDNILEDMKRHEALIDREANARNIAEAREMRQDIRRWREQSREAVTNLDGEEAAKQYQSIVSWLNMDESDQLAIFESISTEGRKHPGTCSWVLKNIKINSWLQSKPDTSVLWLQGTPGSGKSVMSTQIVNFMQTSKMFVIYHFCTYLYTSSTTYEQILRSLLMQLLRKDCDLVAHVYEEIVLGKKSPTVPTLERLLQLLFKSISSEPSKVEYVWILLDGLDECEPEKQARVVSLMNQIAPERSSSGNAACKVLISSRTSQILSSCLRKKQTVSLSEEKDSLEEAIRQYASQRLQTLEQIFHQLHISPEEVDNIERGIAKKADGMFLYARLVLDYLSKNIFYDGAEIMTSINQLPRELSDFYRKILLQILAHLDARSERRIKCILGWIAFAKRPLKRLELLSAITFSSGEPDVAHLVPEYVLNICGPLIEERHDTTLSFIHVSVKEFLQTTSSNLILNQQESLEEHGVATVSCLLSGIQVFSNTYSEHTRYLRVIKGLHGFHVYATEFWTEYILSSARCAGGGLETDSLLFILALQLADTLNKAINPMMNEEIVAQPNESDERILFLRQHPILYKHVEAALKGRSLKRLEAELFPEDIPDGMPRSSKNLPPLDGISAMLTLYQDTVRSLLDQHEYPGVTVEDLELFKSQFRASAFTCRLKSCPRATLGFESEKCRLQHEMTHMRRLRCTFPDCKFPAFISPQALKNHARKYHIDDLPPRSIRSIRICPNAEIVRSVQYKATNTQDSKEKPQETKRIAQEGQTKRKLSVLDANGSSIDSTQDSSESIDAEGEKKVQYNGELIGGRKYRCRTFKRLNGGDTYYMLGADCDILLQKCGTGFSAIYLPQLIVSSKKEIDYLINQSAIPPLLYGGGVALLTARSMFRQYGHRVIEDGRPVHDDYWVTEARERLQAEVIAAADVFFMAKAMEDHRGLNDMVRREARREYSMITFKSLLHRAVTRVSGLENMSDDDIDEIKVQSWFSGIDPLSDGFYKL